MKAVPGVDTVYVSLEKGLATVKMKPGNTTTLKQLKEAITKNGFTMKDSMVSVAGTAVTSNNNTTFQVSGSNDTLNLVPDSGTTVDAATLFGKPVLVQGTIPEAKKGNSPGIIRYRSITELP